VRPLRLSWCGDSCALAFAARSDGRTPLHEVAIAVFVNGEEISEEAVRRAYSNLAHQALVEARTAPVPSEVGVVERAHVAGLAPALDLLRRNVATDADGNPLGEPKLSKTRCPSGHQIEV
jgi:hypothetical protein